MSSDGTIPITGDDEPKRRRRDYRPLALAGVFGGIIFLGAVVSTMTESSSTMATKLQPKPTLADLKENTPGTRGKLAEVEPPLPSLDPADPQASEVKQILAEAHKQIKAAQYDDAIRILHDARPVLQKYADAYLLLARALEGKNDNATARDFYEAAIDRNPYLSEAYWGYATTSESLGELAAALGAMRNYLHTEPNLDPRRLKVAQARSAIWEWESQLERGPWGPTKGIPPGFSREELKRDGRGVGIKMPIPGTENPDGSMKYEIKHQDKFKLFEPD